MKHEYKTQIFLDEFDNQIRTPQNRHIFHRREIRNELYCVLYEIFYTETTLGVAKYIGHSYETGNIVEHKFINCFIYKEIDNVYYLDNMTILNKINVKLLLNSMRNLINYHIDNNTSICQSELLNILLDYYEEMQKQFLQIEINDIKN